jgi:hypothetical protein
MARLGSATTDQSGLIGWKDRAANFVAHHGRFDDLAQAEECGRVYFLNLLF